METIILRQTSLYPGIDPTVNPICELHAGDTVTLIENRCGWSKIQFQNETGYISRKDIQQPKDIKQGNIVISIPFECASALFEALKYALKK